MIIITIDNIIMILLLYDNHFYMIIIIMILLLYDNYYH